MAEDKGKKEKDKEKGKEAPEGAEKAAEGTKGPLLSKKNLIILGVLILLLGVVSFVVIKKMTKVEAHPEGKEKQKKEHIYMYTFDSIIVNVAGTQATRFLKATVGCEYKDEKAKEELDARKVQLMDIMNTICSSRTFDQLASIDERDNMKREIRDKFNEVLGNGEISNVFFNDFVIQ
ncbi:MAG: flagellar basal body-associated protein FliL [uncultured bacterium]|nr:MAG: flagellar basal body-associated protein FliL [uncultured bacterium]